MSIYSGIELFGSLILVIILVGLKAQGSQTRSSRALSWACWANLLCTTSNALIYLNYSPNWQWFLFLNTAITYIMGNVAMLLFTYYDHCYISEHTKISKWLYGVPMVLCVFNFFLSIWSVIHGDVYETATGVYIETEGLPIFIFLLYFAIIIYMPMAAFTKAKEIGFSKICMLSLFSIFPLFALVFYALEIFDYVYCSGSVSLMAMYIFLDNQLVFEKDAKLRQQMEKNQQVLEEAREAAEAANEAKTSFLFNMSHDLRTPMNAIIGYAKLMEQNFSNEQKLREYLSKLNISSNFLLDLINNVLEMSRIESGKMILQEEIHNPREVAERTFLIYADEMAKKDITFDCEYDIQVQYIYFDMLKMQEIFLNLISNALKYTPAGGRISIAIKQIASENGFVTLKATVSDSGVGMSKEYLPYLFDEFSREHTSTEDKVQGTGLGMAIVKKMVDFMGGTITVDSELNKGTTFTLTLRHRIAPSSEVIKEEIPEAVEEKALHGRRLLLAEDNDMNAEIAIEMLSTYGLIVDRAEDGDICVDMLEKAELGYYDGILMDIQMPRMNGYEATKAIRQMSDPMKANIPIIALTANAFEVDRRNALNAGMNDHLLKPIDMDELLRSLKKYLK